jgi:hypothetical protein
LGFGGFQLAEAGSLSARLGEPALLRANGRLGSYSR